MEMNPRKKAAEITLIMLFGLFIFVGVASGGDIDSCGDCNSTFVNLDGDNMTGNLNTTEGIGTQYLNVSEITDLNVVMDEIYYVTTDAELDDAIADIEANDYVGYIHVLEDIFNVIVTFNDADAGYIINLHGHELESDGGSRVMSVENAKFFKLMDGTLNYTDGTGDLGQVLTVIYTGVTPITFQNIRFIGDGQGTIYNGGKNTIFNRCEFTGLYAVFYSSMNDTSIINSNLHNNVVGGTLISAGNDNLIAFNHIQDTNTSPAAMVGGIYLTNGASRNRIIGNKIKNFTTAGSGSGFGIFVDTGCEDNLIDGNIIYDIETAAILDLGTDTVIGDNIT